MKSDYSIPELSRNKRRCLIHLAYNVVAKEAPNCKIKRDALFRSYPDTNYGIKVEIETLEKANTVGLALRAAFERRGYTVGYNFSHDPDGTIRLYIFSFYRVSVEIGSLR